MIKRWSVAHTRIICVIPAHYYTILRLVIVFPLYIWYHRGYIYILYNLYVHTIVLRLFIYYAISLYRFRQTCFLIYVLRSHSMYTSNLSSCKELRHVPRNCMGVRCGIQIPDCNAFKWRYILIIIEYLHSIYNTFLFLFRTEVYSRL